MILIDTFMNIDENKLYTTEEVAEILKVSPITIKRYVSLKKIPSIKFNGLRRFRGDDIAMILQRHESRELKILKVILKHPKTKNSTRFPSPADKKHPKPFMQWVGGKRAMISQYNNFLPKKFKTYYEPLLGGAALFFHLKPEVAVLNDSNLELIKTYRAIKSSPRKVINLLKELKNRHSKELYMKIRSLDRHIDILKELTNEEVAARMIYLNQTCFNGVYRVNSQGQFNVPIGSSLNRLICDEHNILNSSKALRNIILQCKDFEDVINNVKSGDFIYLDPPYFPVSKYSDFTRYTKERFYEKDQIRLKSTIDALTKKRVKVMASNSDCDFINHLYSNYKKHKVYSGRSLNSNRNLRGKVSELLITNY